MPSPSSSIEPFANTATFECASGGDPDAPTRDLNRQPRPNPPDDRPLPTIPGYRIVSRLGRGGMGEVFEAVNARDHTVALKIIRRDRVSKTTIERFGREADAMFDLHHSHIAHFFTYDVAPDGTPYFTMKFVNGGTLADRIADYRDDRRKAGELMVKVAEAVQFLHDKGFIHRDLKPQNILLDRGGEPYVSDFGLVKDLDDLLSVDDLIEALAASGDTDPHFSRAETIVKIEAGGRAHLTAGVIGTLPYASPEQLRNDKSRIGPATDIWALGVILSEIFTGHRPFDSEDNDVLGELIQSGEPSALHNGTVALEPSLAKIIRKCLDKQPEKRYLRTADLVEDLKIWMDPGAKLPTSAKGAISRYRWFRAHPLLVALLGAILVGAAAIPLMLRDRERATASKSGEEDRQRLLLRESLAAGKAFTIVGASGWPVTGVRFPVVGRDGEAAIDSEGFFNLSSIGRSMVELIDDPGADEYIFRVEVQQSSVGNMREALVGLFLGHQTLSEAAGRMEHFAAYDYTEHRSGNGDQTQGMNEFSFRQIWQAAADSERSENSHSNIKWRMTFPHGLIESTYKWRVLSVAVMKEEIRLYWDDQFVRSVPRLLPPSWIQSMNSFGLERAPLVLSARGALGLTVFQGGAAFRNVRIEPIQGR